MQTSFNHIYPKFKESQRKYFSSNPNQAQMPEPEKEKMTLNRARINAKRNISSIMPSLETKLIAQDVKKLLAQIKTKSKSYLDKANEIKELNQYIQNKSRRKVEKLAQNALTEAQDIQAKIPSMADEINELIKQGCIFKYKNFSNPYKSVRFNWQNDKVQSMDEYDSNNHLTRSTTLKEIELRNGKKIYIPETIDEYTKNSYNRYTFENDEQNISLISYQEGIEAVSGIEKCKKQMMFKDGALINYAQNLKAYDDKSESIDTYLYFKDNELKGYKEGFERLQDGSYKYDEAMFYENSKLNEYHQGFKQKSDKTIIKKKAIFDDKTINEYYQGIVQFGNLGERILNSYLFKNGELIRAVEDYSRNRTGTLKYKESIKFNSSKPSIYTQDFEKKQDGSKYIYHKVEFEDGEIYRFEENHTNLPNGQEMIDNVLIYETDGRIIQHIQDHFKTIFGQLYAGKVYNYDAFGKLINI